MKSNAPWSVKGIERDARETAKEAARREGMTVGEWLNQVIYTASDPQTSNGEIEGLKISDLVTAIEHLNKRVIHAEFKGAAAIDNLARNFGGVVERLQRVERKPSEGGEAGGDAVSGDLEARLEHLEAKGADRQRIETLKALERAVGQVAVQFDVSQKTSVVRMDATEKQLQQLATRIDAVNIAAAAASGQDPAAVTLFTDTIDTLQARIERAERVAQQAAEMKTEAETIDGDFVERTGARLRVLGDEIKRGGDQIRSLETSIKKLSDQIDAAEKRSSEGVQKVAETISELKTQFGGTSDDGAKTRIRVEQAVAAATRRTEERISALQRSFENMISRLETPGGVTPGQAATIVAEEIQAAEEESEEEPFQPFDLDAEAEETIAAEDSDEDAFAFDLDKDEASDGPAETLTEETSTTEPETETAPPTALDQPDGLDAILAELDGLTGGGETPIGDAQGGSLSVIEAAGAETAAPAGPTDFLKEARRAAKEAAERAAAEQTTRRRLTPKQRAILAAKIRRKRLAEQGLGPAPEVAPETPPVALLPDSTGDTTGKPATTSFFARATGALAGLRVRLPGKTTGDETTTEPARTEPAISKPGIAGKLQGLVAQAKTKPVTAALGVAILLAAAALFFLIKDLASGDKTTTAAALAPSVAQTPSARTAQTQAGSETATGIETPTAPTLDTTHDTSVTPPATQPRDLYLDSVGMLKSAKNDGELRAAIAGLEQAAALGHPPAQLQLGELYKLGQGVDADLSQARAWYERAANGGNVLAMHRVGVMAARGQGGPIDQTAAVGWFEKASNLGLVDSQYNLGAIYHPGGDGAANAVQNAGKAYYWYSLAATNGDEQAGSLASGLASGLAAEERRRIDADVAAWRAQTPNAEANEVAPAS